MLKFCEDGLHNRVPKKQKEPCAYQASPGWGQLARGPPAFRIAASLTDFASQVSIISVQRDRSEEESMADEYQPQIRSADDMPADNRRGGDVRTLLSPKTVGSSTGFMGMATIAPDDWISEHYHPFSEEFIYVVSGSLVAELDGERHDVPSRHGLFIPINVKHRLRNESDEEAQIVFHLGPLAPRPHMGHVDTEERQPAAAATS